VDGKPVKLRIPDKIAAAKELVRVCCWAKPDRIELSATDALAEFVQSIRKVEQASAREQQRFSQLTRGLDRFFGRHGPNVG
jgi:hypothetical protein